MAISQPCCAPQHAPARSYRDLVPLLCHDTMYYIVTKTGKWAVAHPTAKKLVFFFFHFIFFPLFQLLQDHQKKKKNFMSPVEPNKYLFKIYIYIYIYIPCFTHCKTSEKNFFNTFFFPMCYSSSTQFTQHTQQFMLYTPFIKCTKMHDLTRFLSSPR